MQKMLNPALSGFALRPNAVNDSPYQLPEHLRPKQSWGLASIFDSLRNGGASQYELGTPVTTTDTPAVNTAQVDGSSDFLNKLSGFGRELLGSIGGKPEGQPAVIPASYGGGGSGGGVDLRMVAMIGLAGAVVYYATKS